MDESSDIVSKSRIVYRHGIDAKPISAAVFTAAEDLAILNMPVVTNHVPSR